MASCLLFVIGTSTLHAQENFTVMGQVVNETHGGSIGSGLEILLHMLDQESGQFLTLETMTNERGEFQFENILFLVCRSLTLITCNLNMMNLKIFLKLHAFV